jgi:hypothetical protein
MSLLERRFREGVREFIIYINKIYVYLLRDSEKIKCPN